MKSLELCYCNRRGSFFAGVFSKRSLVGRIRFAQMFSYLALFAMAVILIATGASAQSHKDLANAVEAPKADSMADFVDPYATAGPTIYITDAAGHLATVTMGTYTVHVIGSEGVILTDIGFNPKDSQLYGVSFSAFYRVNKTTGKATLIGPLGINDANALVFDGQGVAYTAGVDTSELYTINMTTGRVTGVGSMKPFKSAGDLTFYNGGLVVSGYYQSSLTDTTPDTLVLVNPSNAKVLAYSELDIANLFGIVCTGKDLLFGFAGTNLYQLFPGQTSVGKRSVLLKNLSGKGLAQIYGAAYDGYFLY
jgi:hypothetical protein